MKRPNAHSSPTSPGRPIAQVSFLHSTADFLFVQELAPPFSWGARYPWSKRSDVPPFAHGIRTSRIHAMVVAFHLLKITKKDFLSICQRDRRARDAGEPTPEPHPAHCSRDLLRFFTCRRVPPSTLTFRLAVAMTGCAQHSEQRRVARCSFASGKFH